MAGGDLAGWRFGFEAFGAGEVEPILPAVGIFNLGRHAPAREEARPFEAGGLAAPSGDGFAQRGATDFDALVGAFRGSGAKLACLCGSDAAYAEEGAAAAELLTEAGATVWLAGRPGDSEAALNKAGVSSFIFTGCDVVETLERAQALASA